ncbi:MAG: response regulator transcription factor [Candidatus Dormibacteraeota bacterium]|nr:response regulator transcription factor [Candidatus Dormibacteraeota bacterium]
MALILVVEDEVDLNGLLRDQLRAEGHEVRQAFDGATALQLVEEGVPDLVILDWMLPDLDGLTVCRRLRESHLMPIIMLTARSEEVDRVLGLEVGADDYVPKPFSVRELMARARAVLRRVALDARQPPAASAPKPEREKPGEVVHGALRIDTEGRRASVAGQPLNLTPKEYELLALFAANPGRAFSRDYLIDRIWKEEFDGFDRVIDTHIRRLRRKLGPVGDRIVTVWGLGYRFDEDQG